MESVNFTYFFWDTLPSLHLQLAGIHLLWSSALVLFEATQFQHATEILAKLHFKRQPLQLRVPAGFVLQSQ